MQNMQNNIEMTSDPYYPRVSPAVLQNYGGGPSQQGGYGKIYRAAGPGQGTSQEGHQDLHHTSSFSSVPPQQMQGVMGTDVITEQPMQSYGSQISTGMSSSAGGFGRPMSVPPGPPPPSSSSMGMTQHHPSQIIGVPLPGLEVLDRVPSFKITTAGLLEGHTTCTPGYRIHNLQGELVLNGFSDTLFCPFDSKQKSIYIKDTNEDCIFQLKFTPSICECDSEEKRCFAVFSPVFENPFGAIMFEAGQLKYSMKILNALEGETFAVQFLGSQDVSIKGADGSIVAIINVHRKRGEGQRYTLTFMEEVSAANKALFISTAITLNLVSCEGLCSRCICLAPILLACLAIIGLSIGSVTGSKGGKPG